MTIAVSAWGSRITACDWANIVSSRLASRARMRRVTDRANRHQSPGAGTDSPKRVLLFGVTGSGKTTLARQISEVTGLPWHSVDDEIGWLPGWIERPRAEQRELASRIASSEEWVLDTAYSHWRDVVLPRAELIVALDYARLVSLARLSRRTARRVVTRQPVCNGNQESLRQALSSDSIVVWHFRSFSRKRERIDAWQADPSAPPVVRLRSPHMTEEWLAGLRQRCRIGS
jgi:adenylate kinase family enzyme